MVRPRRPQRRRKMRTSEMRAIRGGREILERRKEWDRGGVLERRVRV